MQHLTIDASINITDVYLCFQTLAITMIAYIPKYSIKQFSTLHNPTMVDIS